MKIIILILVIVFSIGIGTAYSQSDTIPVWIKGVAGFWADDKITDSEFIEALEFLIESNIIQVDDSQKIQELEKENTELKQKIESLESKETKHKTTVEPQTPLDGLKSYVETDKTEYTLGDTIHLTGLKIIPEPSYGFHC